MIKFEPIFPFGFMSFNCFPREGDCVAVELVREDTNTQIPTFLDRYTTSSTTSTIVRVIPLEEGLLEGNYYSINLINAASESLYRDKLYVISQDNESNSINTGSYMSYDTDDYNEYIIIE